MYIYICIYIYVYIYIGYIHFFCSLHCSHGFGASSAIHRSLDCLEVVMFLSTAAIPTRSDADRWTKEVDDNEIFLFTDADYETALSAGIAVLKARVVVISS